MSTRPDLRLVVSNKSTQTSGKPCLTSAIRPSRSLNVTLDQIVSDLQELLVLKPTYVGGIAVLVRDQVQRMRIEHPSAAQTYAECAAAQTRDAI